MKHTITKNLLEPACGYNSIEEYKKNYRGYQEREEYISDKGILTFVPKEIKEDWNSEIESIVIKELAKKSA